MTEEDKLYADELRNRALADYERLDLAINELERQTSSVIPQAESEIRNDNRRSTKNFRHNSNDK